MNAILWWAGQVTLAAGILAAIAYTFARVWPKRPALAHALWLIVLIKFVTPPLVAWPWLIAIEKAPATARVVDNQLDAAPVISALAPPETPAPVTPAIEQPSDSSSELAEEPRPPVFTEPIVVDAPVDLPGPAPIAHVDAPPVVIGAQDEPIEQTAATARPVWMNKHFWGQACIVVWLAGALVAFLCQARRIVRHRRIASLAAPAPGWLVDEVQRLAAKMRVRSPAVGVSPLVASPIVWCVGRPTLLWPHALATPAEVARFRGVIAHELAHLSRRDHLVAWIELIVGLAWWWNPLAWYARRRLREAAEQACDARALDVLDALGAPGASSSGRRQYAELFVELSCLSPRSAGPSPALGVASGGRRTFEKRLMLMLTDRVSSRLSWRGLLVAAALLLIALPAFTLGQAPPPVPEEPPPPIALPFPMPMNEVSPAAGLPTAPGNTSAAALPLSFTAPPSGAAPSIGLAPPLATELPATTPPSGFPEPVLPEAADPNLAPPPTTPAPIGLPQVGPFPSAAESRLEERLARLEAAVARIADALEGKGPPASSSPRFSPPVVSYGRPAKAAPATPPIEAPQPTAATRVASSAEQNPASSLESLDLVNLSTSYADALGEVKLAQRTFSRIKGQEGNVSQSEIDAAEIHLETAERKQKVLTMIVRVALENAKAEFQHAHQLHQKGFVSDSMVLQAKTKLEIIEAILE